MESTLKEICNTAGVLRMKMQACTLFQRGFAKSRRGHWTHDAFERLVNVKPLNNYGKLNHPQIFHWDVKDRNFEIEDTNIAIGGVAYDRKTNRWFGIEYEFGQEWGIKVPLDYQWILDNYTSGQIAAVKVKSLKKRKFLAEVPGAAHEHRSMDIECLRSNPVIEYEQRGDNTCAFKSIASVLHYTGYVGAGVKINNYCSDFYADISLYDNNCGRIMQHIIQKCIRTKDSNFVDLNKKYICLQIGHEYDLLNTKMEEQEFAWIVVHGSDKSCCHCIAISNSYIFDATLPLAMPLTKQSLDECAGDGATYTGVFFGYLFKYKYI